MSKVLCFGEIMLRIAPTAEGDWLVNNSVPVYVGGAELNVAVALAKWNVPVSYCTEIPDNYISKEIETFVRAKKIDTSTFRFSGSRIGLYYLPQGKEIKNEGVVYDRDHSSFASIEPGEINWDEILEGVKWFHFTAITPALTQQAVEVCKEALAEASKRNITISVDLNHREKLWKYGIQPIKIMPELAEYCDVVMGNIWSANTLLDIPIDVPPKGSAKQVYLDHSQKTSEEIMRRFNKCKSVANTFRFDKGAGIRYFTTLFTQDKLFQSPEFLSEKIIDKVGSGDCFMGGLIYGLYNNHAPQDVINFAAASAFGKLNELGDITNQTIEDVNTTLNKFLL